MAQINNSNNKSCKSGLINKNIVFFDVDTQHDYLSESSIKAIKNISEIKKKLAKLTNFAIENNIKILGSVDVNKNMGIDKTNDDNKINYVNLTNARNKIPETFVQGTIFVPNRKVDEQLISKALQTNFPVLVEKQAYSCFQNPNTDAIVEMIKINNINQNKDDQTTAIVYGVATEYCVKEAVLGLLSRGIKVLLVKDAIGAINQEFGEEALKEMQSAGAIIAESKDVLIAEEIII